MEGNAGEEYGKDVRGDWKRVVFLLLFRSSGSLEQTPPVFSESSKRRPKSTYRSLTLSIVSTSADTVPQPDKEQGREIKSRWHESEEQRWGKSANLRKLSAKLGNKRPGSTPFIGLCHVNELLLSEVIAGGCFIFLPPHFRQEFREILEPKWGCSLTALICVKIVDRE